MIAGLLIGALAGGLSMALVAGGRIKELERLLSETLDELSESCDQQEDLLDYFGGHENGTRHH